MTLSRHLLALGLALGALPLTGCEALLVAALAEEDDDEEDYESDDWGDSWSDSDEWGLGGEGFDGGIGWANEESLTVAGSTLSGGGGDARTFSGGVWLESGSRFGTEYDVIQVEARNRNAGWKSMVVVTVWGTLDHEAFAIGTERTFDVWDYEDGTVDGYVIPDVLGCTGPADEEAEYDWDENSERVDVTVKESETPGMKRVDMVATYASGATVDFSFDVATTLGNETTGDEQELDEEVAEEGIGTESNGIGDGGV